MQAGEVEQDLLGCVPVFRLAVVIGLMLAVAAPAWSGPPGSRGRPSRAPSKARAKVKTSKAIARKVPATGQLRRRTYREAGRRLALPNVRQTTDYTCGPASLLAVFRYFGVARHLGEMDLAKQAHTNSDVGSDSSALVRVARRHGLDATLRTRMTVDDLARHTRAGRPVLVLYQAWADTPATADYTSYDSGHFSVVIGVDADNVYLQDPWIKGARGVLSRQEFQRRWHGMERSLPGGEQKLRQPGIVLSSSRQPTQSDVRNTVRPID